MKKLSRQDVINAWLEMAHAFLNFARAGSSCHFHNLQDGDIINMNIDHHTLEPHQ